MRDFRNDVFAAALALGPPRPPVTERMMFPDGRPSGNGRSEVDHMIGWFLGQETLGAGAYSRRRPNYSARVTYGRLMAGGGLVAIGENLGAPPGAVAAAAELQRAGGRAAPKCHAIRRALPWRMVSPLVAARIDARPDDIRATVADIRRECGLPEWPL